MPNLLTEADDNATNNGAEWQDFGVKPFCNLVVSIEKLGESGPESGVGVILHSSDGHGRDWCQKVSLLLEKAWWKERFFDIAIAFVESESNQCHESYNDGSDFSST